MASCQPSGVARSHERRERLPFSSFLWQAPHLSTTNWFVTGIPSSLGGLGFGGSSAITIESATTLITTERTNTKMPSNEDWSDYMRFYAKTQKGAMNLPPNFETNG